jgi:hypothetical protein
MKRPKVAQLKKLLGFMEERQRIFLRRQAGEPWPWTKDPILRRYRFCCVYRELDKVTIWLRQHWREPYANSPNLWFAMCIARMINLPETLDAIGFPEEWNPRRVLRILEQRKREGKQIYSGAYMLGGGIKSGASKPRYTVMEILNPVWRAVFTGKSAPPWMRVSQATTLQSSFEWLLPFHGWGKFLVYEVITDLRHTRYLQNAPDIQTWANVGPGAQRGLNRLYERDLNGGHPQAQLLEELLVVKEWIEERRDRSLLPTLEARDIEHSLCETDKMERARERLAAGKNVGLERFKAPGLV